MHSKELLQFWTFTSTKIIIIACKKVTEQLRRHWTPFKYILPWVAIIIVNSNAEEIKNAGRIITHLNVRNGKRSVRGSDKITKI